MSNSTTKLQVLLVEDEPEDLKQYERDLPSVFSSCKVDADIHPCVSFEDAFARTSNPLYRYDMIVSDTYKGQIQKRDAQVMKMVDKYRGTRFCPLVVYSSGVKPPELYETAFVIWADKGKSGDIERAITQLLNTNIPQLARKLHDELELSAGSYLWDFLEKKWEQLMSKGGISASILEHLIRRRAGVQIGRIDPIEVKEVRGVEFYTYNPDLKERRLGEIVKDKEGNFRVILTPHCHLNIQEGETLPRADYVLTVKAFPVDQIINKECKSPNGDLKNPWKGKKSEIFDKLRRRINSPAELGKPSGRYWFLPAFLDIIPDMYCDFMQVENIPFVIFENSYEKIVILDTPFAEALQSCFTKFYSAVGIPNLDVQEFKHIIEKTTPN